MQVNNPKFYISAVSKKQYPTNGMPEIVLAGKSNVGKSSFINTLINRKSLARTSSEPGKTRQINFYDIDSKFYFVDLPGYGYSKMSKKEQENVGKFIEEYLFTRKNISVIILILDIRHKPTQNDIIMYEYIKSTNLPFVILLNKADKIAITKVDSALKERKNDLGLLNENITILPFSSERKIYNDAIWKEIEKYI